MSVSDLFIRRPVFAIVANLLLVIAGLYGLTQLAIRHFPQITFPSVSVTTILPGASPYQVEQQVTAPIEQAVSAIDGVQLITSSSRQQFSSVNIEFGSVDDVDGLAAKVNQKVQQIAGQLPDDVEPPVVSQSSSDAIPMMYLTVSHPRRSALELTDMTNRLIKPQISIVPGIAALEIMGERRYAMRIDLDPLKLAAHNVTAQDVVSALRRQNVRLPAGTIEDRETTRSVLAKTGIDLPHDFEQVVIASSDYVPVRISDVASVHIGAEAYLSGIIVDGREAVGLSITKRGEANAIEIAKGIRSLIPRLQVNLPEGTKIEVAFDNTVSIDRSLDEVKEAALQAIGLVIAVIFLFLGSPRSTFIAIVTIPLSLIGTLAFLAVLGYSLNIFTILAFILAVGLVVDDAIVDIENVDRHIAQGLTPLDAAFVGSREIGFAIIATTIMLASIFLPIGLLPGMAGILLREFAFTLAIAILLSGYVSRTLSPMMCSRLLRAKRPGGVSDKIDRGFEWLAQRYEKALRQCLKTRWAVLLSSIVLLAVGGLSMSSLDKEMAPLEDQGVLMVSFTGPDSASYDYMRRQAVAVEALLRTVPEAQSAVATFALNSGFGILVLKPWEDRERSAVEIAALLEPQLDALPGVETTFQSTDPLQSGGSGAIEIVITTSFPYDDLARVADDFLARARQIPGLRSPSFDLRLYAPQVTIDIDRDLAANLGVGMSELNNTLSTAFGKTKVTSFSWQDELYAVVMGLEQSLQDSVDAIEQMFVRSENGELIPLAALVAVRNDVSASSLPRYALQHAATLKADVAAGFSGSAVLSELVALARETLPPGYSTDLAGLSHELQQTGASIGQAFILAMVFIYLVLCAQFESFRDPAITLATVPLTIVAGLASLLMVGGSLNLFSAVGLITLVGLIAKHGILISEFANQLRDEGLGIYAAVERAAVTRLRPILMTTLTMVLGAMPLALASGAGAGSRQSIGVVIVGGLAIGTLFSLFVVPVAYTAITRKVRKPLAQPPEARTSSPEDNAVPEAPAETDMPTAEGAVPPDRLQGARAHR